MGRVKGFVSVLWRIHNPVPLEPEAFLSVCRIWEASPVKLSAYHVCKPLVSFNLKNFNGKLLLQRAISVGVIRLFKSHYGTAMECKGSSMDYGCPVECFPLLEDSNSNNEGSQRPAPFHTRYVKTWIRNRKRTEQERSRKRIEQERIQRPTRLSAILREVCKDIDEDVAVNSDTEQEVSNSRGDSYCREDIFLGQNPMLRNRPGNVRFRELVKRNYDKYYSSERSQKIEKMTNDIIRLIGGYGGRFLKLVAKKTDEPLWEEVRGLEARRKVSSSFRDLKKKRGRALAQTSRGQEEDRNRVANFLNYLLGDQNKVCDLDQQHGSDRNGDADGEIFELEAFGIEEDRNIGGKLS